MAIAAHRLLGRPHAGVEPAGGDEVVVAAALGNPPLVEHQDLVDVGDGVQAVGDDDHGALAGELRDRGLDLRLVLGVGEGGGLVQDQDRRVLEDGTGDRDALALAAGQAVAALPDQRVVAVRQSADEVVGAGGLGGGGDVGIAGVGAAESDVVGDGAGEQEHVLEHHGEAGVKVLRAHVADVDTADAHRAAAHVEEAGDQPHQRRLARPARADQCQAAAGLDPDRDAVDDRARAIGEADLIEIDRRRADGALGLGLRHFGQGENRLDIVEMLELPHHPVADALDGAENVAEAEREREEHRQRRDADLAGRRHQQPRRRHHQQMARQQDLREAAGHHGAAHPIVGEPRHQREHAKGALRRLLGLIEHAHRRQAVGDLGGGLGELGLDFDIVAGRPFARFQQAAEQPHADHHRHQRQHRQPPVDHDEGDQHQRRREQRGAGLGDEVGDAVLGGLDVVEQDRADAALRSVVEPAERHPRQLGREAQSQLLLHPEGDEMGQRGRQAEERMTRGNAGDGGKADQQQAVAVRVRRRQLGEGQRGGEVGRQREQRRQGSRQGRSSEETATARHQGQNLAGNHLNRNRRTRPDARFKPGRRFSIAFV